MSGSDTEEAVGVTSGSDTEEGFMRGSDTEDFQHYLHRMKDTHEKSVLRGRVGVNSEAFKAAREQIKQQQLEKAMAYNSHSKRHIEPTEPAEPAEPAPNSLIRDHKTRGEEFREILESASQLQVLICDMVTRITNERDRCREDERTATNERGVRHVIEHLELAIDYARKVLAALHGMDSPAPSDGETVVYTSSENSNPYTEARARVRAREYDDLVVEGEVLSINDLIDKLKSGLRKRGKAHVRPHVRSQMCWLLGKLDVFPISQDAREEVFKQCAPTLLLPHAKEGVVGVAEGAFERANKEFTLARVALAGDTKTCRMFERMAWRYDKRYVDLLLQVWSGMPAMVLGARCGMRGASIIDWHCIELLRVVCRPSGPLSKVVETKYGLFAPYREMADKCITKHDSCQRTCGDIEPEPGESLLNFYNRVWAVACEVYYFCGEIYVVGACEDVVKTAVMLYKPRLVYELDVAFPMFRDKLACPHPSVLQAYSPTIPPTAPGSTTTTATASTTATTTTATSTTTTLTAASSRTEGCGDGGGGRDHSVERADSAPLSSKKKGHGARQRRHPPQFSYSQLQPGGLHETLASVSAFGQKVLLRVLEHFPNLASVVLVPGSSQLGHPGCQFEGDVGTTVGTTAAASGGSGANDADMLGEREPVRSPKDGTCVCGGVGEIDGCHVYSKGGGTEGAEGEGGATASGGTESNEGVGEASESVNCDVRSRGGGTEGAGVESGTAAPGGVGRTGGGASQKKKKRGTRAGKGNARKKKAKQAGGRRKTGTKHSKQKHASKRKQVNVGGFVEKGVGGKGASGLAMTGSKRKFEGSDQQQQGRSKVPRLSPRDALQPHTAHSHGRRPHMFATFARIVKDNGKK